MTMKFFGGLALGLSSALLLGSSCEPPGEGEGEGEGEPVECFFGDEGADPVGELIYRKRVFAQHSHGSLAELVRITLLAIREDARGAPRPADATRA